MTFAAAFRRILTGSSSPSQFASIRLNSTLATLTSPKLFISGRENGTNKSVDSPNIVGQESEEACEAIIRALKLCARLSRQTTDENLYKAFASFGRLREAKVINDRASGRSKGFGFVTYETVEEAEKAREGMNSKFLDGWVIFVDPARPREAQPRQPPPQQESTDTGFTTNKTVGWSGF